MHHCFLIIEVVVVTQLTADVLFHVSSFVFNWIGVLRFCWLIHSCNTAAFKHWSAVVSVWPGVVVNLYHVGRSLCPRNKANGYLQNFFPVPLAIEITPNCQWLDLPFPWHSFQNQHPTSTKRWSGITKFGWIIIIAILSIGGICWIVMCSAVIHSGIPMKTQFATFRGNPPWVWKSLEPAPCTFQLPFQFQLRK